MIILDDPRLLPSALGMTCEQDCELAAATRCHVRPGRILGAGLEKDRDRVEFEGCSEFAGSDALVVKAHWDDLRRLFSDAEIVEISLITGLFNMINRLNDSFRTELEPAEVNRRQGGALGISLSALNEYGCRVCAART